MSNALFGDRFIEDPSIAQVSVLEYERLWGRIGSKVSLGVPFFTARELVLAEEMIDVSSAYGRVVASRVTAAIERTSPDRLPKTAKRAARDQTASILLAQRPNMPWYDRLCMQLVGLPWTTGDGRGR